MMTVAGWTAYHEALCSKGAPWDCKKKCALWRRFEHQRQEAERATAAGEATRTYMELTRG